MMPTPGSSFADEPVDSSTVSRDILNTNDAPAEHNLPSIREFVSRGSARRAYLDAKIAPLRAELNKLLEERDFLDTEIRKHEGALSPLRRIPPEILSLIFTCASPSNASLMNLEDGPWPLSRVCSRWRTIALSQPSLWNELSLNFTDDLLATPEVLGIFPLVEAHLERSQNLPLDIAFSPYYETHCTESEQSVLDLLVTHCYHWETILFSGAAELYDSLMVHIYGRLPTLRKLDIRVSSPLDAFENDEPGADISHLFEYCPALQEAFINLGRYGGKTPVTAELPCVQLLRYGASNLWTNHIEVLSSATNLVDCVLRLIDPEGVPPPERPIVLPQLRRLSTSTAAVLDHLDTPALRELYCSDHSTGLSAFLTRCPKLEQLFSGEIPTAADIGVLLRAAPATTNLFLHLPIAFSSDLFSLLDTPTLAANPEQPATLPVLDTLSLGLNSIERTLGPLDVDEDQLMRVVEGRWEHGSLRALHLYAMRFTPSAVTLGRMQALRAQGMEIVLYKRSDYMYRKMVSPDFCIYDDFF